MTDKPTFIQAHPPADGRQYDCQCARCGSSCDWVECTELWCDGGYLDPYLDEECEDETLVCPECLGYSGWNMCLSPPEYCQANPLPGRETVARGKLEWFSDDWSEHEEHA